MSIITILYKKLIRNQAANSLKIKNTSIGKEVKEKEACWERDRGLTIVTESIQLLSNPIEFCDCFIDKRGNMFWEMTNLKSGYIGNAKFKHRRLGHFKQQKYVIQQYKKHSMV